MSNLTKVALCIAAGVVFKLLARVEPDRAKWASRQFQPVQVSLNRSHGAPERLSQFIQFKTVSNPDTASHALDAKQFTKAHKFLQSSYPSVYKQLKAEKINDLSLLYTWRGTQPQLDPVLLVAHLDVVPADDSPGSPWSHPPFGGEIDEGYVWGRGAMDIKFVVTATLEAVSELLGRGFQPERTVHLAFGHDEEVGGDQGAAKISQLLKSRGVRLDILLDEGGLVAIDGLSPLTNAKIALVGTAEKGYESVTVEMAGRGGHSSMPPIDKKGKGLQVPARLAKLMHAVESQPPQIMMTDPMPAFIRAVTPTCSIPVLRWLLGLAQRWPALLAHVLARKGPDTAALVRTTAAVTYLHAHTADNVLPNSGKVGFNFRLLPGHIPGEYAYQYLQQRLGADMEHAKLRPSSDEPATAASAVSSCTSRRFKLVERALQETMQDEQGLVVVPFLLVGATDSRHYPDITAGGTHVYRFNALKASLKQKDISRVHGIDERIEVKGYLQAIQFYVRFLELATLADAT